MPGGDSHLECLPGGSRESLRTNAGVHQRPLIMAPAAAWRNAGRAGVATMVPRPASMDTMQSAQRQVGKISRVLGPRHLMMFETGGGS